jgi:hypothetical protein
MSARPVMLAVALMLVVSCSAPELATPGFTDGVAAQAGTVTGDSAPLPCPAAPGTASTP